MQYTQTPCTTELGHNACQRNEYCANVPGESDKYWCQELKHCALLKDSYNEYCPYPTKCDTNMDCKRSEYCSNFQGGVCLSMDLECNDIDTTDLRPKNRCPN